MCFESSKLHDIKKVAKQKVRNLKALETNI